MLCARRKKAWSRLHQCIDERLSRRFWPRASVQSAHVRSRLDAAVAVTKRQALVGAAVDALAASAAWRFVTTAIEHWVVSNLLHNTLPTGTPSRRGRTPSPST